MSEALEGLKDITTELATMDTSIGTINTALGTTIPGKMDTANTALGNIHTDIGTTVAGKIDTLNTALGTLNSTLGAFVAATSLPVYYQQSAALDHESFTDNGDATCKINTALTIPAGCIAIGAKMTWTEAPAVDGAAGETDITCTIGDATDGDVDRLGAAMDTVIATGLPASHYDTPVGDAVYAAATAVWLHATLSGGAPDASNFVAAGGAGKAVVTVAYINASAL